MSQTLRKGTAHLLGSYIVGFVMSLALTAIAYTIVVNHDSFSHGYVIAAITALALVQFVTQLVFFLHVGTEPKSRWKLVVLAGMVIVVAILVGGSLWIMNHLNYHMDAHDVNTYLHDQDGL